MNWVMDWVIGHVHDEPVKVYKVAVRAHTNS